jgi:hypothetical protein
MTHLGYGSKPLPTLESSIESHNRAYAVKLGIIFRKLNFGEGWPDRLLLYRGAVLFIEYKQKGAKPTKLQEWMHDKLRAQGFEVHVIDNSLRGQDLIKEWHDRIDNQLAGVRPGDDPDERPGPHVQRDRWAELNPKP